ncbi:SRPBCC family protein [Kibdelosporangium persicum]|uniref:Carbon monoxide dehydrogenase subunit G n=1 Tax=Kibdelosporangium persicum TaxID=2698649 RepID=A0ABX2F3C7_9PSEU|nr:SRPBCC family protein [Kibdelosporangium persicum]NRN65839.1 Carbon monoxide dehydrogenase subunit G [Kibdelosporangium persicum]
MTKVSVSASMPVKPAKAWATASDLSRFGEWLALHEGWRGDVPSEIKPGTVLTSVVSVKGLRNRITWSVISYDPPNGIALSGEGKAGVKASLELKLRPDGEGAKGELDVEFTGPGMFGPISAAVGRTLKSDLHRSLERLAELAD